MKIYSYQNFVKMLNMGLENDLISCDEAVELLCEHMPLTFHKGEITSPSLYGVTVLNKRLVAWLASDDCTQFSLRDIWSMLEGN